MNYYAQAIEICSTEQNWKEMIIKIAKKHPKIVVDSAYSNLWKIKGKQIRDEQSKIEAIKYCRSMTGMGLKEAKESVEDL